MGWLRFWGSCLKWSFWRWDQAEHVGMTVLSIVLAPVGASGVIRAMTEQNVWWLLMAVPIAVITVLVAPYQKYLAKGKELANLEARVAKLEEAPNFLLKIEKKGYGPAGPVGSRDITAIWITLQIRITNIGARGAALDWAIAVNDPNGNNVKVSNLAIVNDIKLSGGASEGTYRSSDWLPNKTREALEHNDTDTGYLLGEVPTELGDVIEECAFIARCENFRGDIFTSHPTTLGAGQTVEWLGGPGVSPITTRRPAEGI